MRRRRFGLLVAAMGAAATLSAAAPPASADEGGGVTVEEFVCFRELGGDRIRLGTGKIITTPSGNTHVTCTGQPL
jgi:hypothetical protein